MEVDCDRHAGVVQHTELFAHMSLAWRKHFERDEWIGAINLASNHIRVSDNFRQPAPERYVPPVDDDRLVLVTPHQGLTVNGWADRVAAGTYLEALNDYGIENWTSSSSRLAMLATPFDPPQAAANIRRRASSPGVGAVALPLVPEMLGSRVWDPIYEACVETGLPLVVHFSGVEGNYLGAPSLSGGVHRSAFSRLTLMPHLAESTISSLTFGGAIARFPQLQVLFTGFGFTWLPSLMWRIDREWRTFRADVPWVTDPPSRQVIGNMWFASYPVGEAAREEEWQRGFGEELRERLVFGSHAPFDADTPAEVERLLGAQWATRLMENGRRALQGASVPAAGDR